MATYRIKLLLLFILISAGLYSGEKDRLNEIFESILIKYAKIKFYEASFQQENYWKDLEINRKSEGKVYFDTEHFYLKYSQPEGQILFIKGSTITVFDAATRQAMISDNPEIELRPDKLISGYWDYSEKQLLFEEDDLIKLKLITPQKNQIDILIQDYLVIEILFLDTNQNFVLYKFKDAFLNNELPENIFQVVLPEDASIIDRRN